MNRLTLFLLLLTLLVLFTLPSIVSAEVDGELAVSEEDDGGKIPEMTEVKKKGGKKTKKGKKKKSPSEKKNWNKLVDDLDKEWEEGDDPTELEEEFEHIRKVQAQKAPRMNMEDPESIRRAYNQDPFAFSGGGGMMIFVDLKPKQQDGKEWTKDDVDLLSKRYASLLRSGSITASLFNLGENRMLVNLDKSWNTRDTLKFLAEQPDVESFTANNKVYTAKDFEDNDDDL